ncbi:MAG: HD domain-containing protein [bacterium]|nr:HD domain-containing protein [bacterium]
MKSNKKKQMENFIEGLVSVIFELAKLAEVRDKEPGGHLRRISEYSRTLACVLQKAEKYKNQIDTYFIYFLYNASYLHDIGKIRIPEKILLSRNTISVENFNIIKTHTTIGANFLKEAYKEYPDNDFIKFAIQIAEGHHERWDGRGYPNGLSGESIPLCARIVALADVYDALTSERVYKEAFPHSKSKDIIIKSSGSHLDPELVEAFLEAEGAFIEIKNGVRN